MDLSRYIDATLNDASAVDSGTPSITQVPPQSSRSIAARIRATCPTHSKAKSTPALRTPRTASVLSTKWVAPNSSAICSLRALVSTAMILLAPASAAPWMTLRPMPPTPITATLAPSGTRARCSTAPTPVRTPQPTSAAEASGTSGGIGTAWLALTTVRSENTEALAKEYVGWSRQVNGVDRPPKVDRHIVGRPASQNWHAPQLPSVDSTTWSPTFTLVTESPTASMTPAPSCPSTTGVGKGMVPLITDRSLWHSPAASMRTATSPGPGSRTDRSSTTW